MADAYNMTGQKWQNRIVGYDNVPPDQLLANPMNFRVHPKRQQDALNGSLNELGWLQDIIVNRVTDHVLDGHLRVQLALRNAEPTVPVKYVEISEDEERLALAIFDPITYMAETDAAQLDALLQQVNTGEAALQGVLAELAEGAGLYQDKPAVDAAPQIDRAEELRVKWGVETGQLWQLGDHRLICGDCTDAAVVARVLRGDVPLLMVTDPPYGVNYDPNWRNEAAEKGLLAYAARRVGKVDNDDRIDWSDAYSLFPGDVAYTWSPPGDHVILTGLALQDCGYEIRNQIMWRKPHFPISRGHYTYQHEPCWYGVKKGRTAHWIGDANASTVWDISLDKNVDGGHGTQKPLECMARPIRNHDSEFVYEPFSGSGTTIIACEQLVRRCRAVEISPGYVGVALQRFYDATQKLPVLVSRA